MTTTRIASAVAEQDAEGLRPGWAAWRFMWIECFASAAHSLRARPLRSGLTMLGVVIGVASVICVVALLQGMSRSIVAQLQGLGGSTLTLRADTPFEQQLTGIQNRLPLRDLEQLAYHIDGIGHLTPLVSFGGGGVGNEVRSGNRSAASQVLGTTASYLDVHQGALQLGRFLTPEDDRARRRVAVIGARLQRDLHLGEDPVGRFLLVGGEWFKVVGVMEARGDLFGISQDNYVLVPFHTAVAMNGEDARPDLWISFRVEDPDAIDATKAHAAALVRRLHGLKAGQPDDFVVEAADSLARSFHDVSVLMTAVVAGIVSISLLVSGVGIMNIMLVSVTERTREIGIAKALGAPSRYVLLQFLLEASLLSGVGGLLGIASGFGLAWIGSRAIPNFPSPDLPAWLVLGAFAFSVCTGIGFGLLPAGKASRLSPIEALRHE